MASLLGVSFDPNRLGHLSPQSFSSISTDTRTLLPGSIFVALRGETFDGSRFVEQAFAKGAVAAIIDHPIPSPPENVPPGSLWVVPDTLTAYQSIAHQWRQHFQIPIIAITGSAGKTSTKEMVAAALERFGPVLKSAANHNNDIGVAETLLKIEPHHRFVVLEMAMRGMGEIARLATTAAPTHALITNIGTAHIGRLGSQLAIAQAKCELLQAGSLQAAILNGEDDLLLTTAEGILTQPLRTFGLERGDVRGHWDPQAQTVIVDDVTLPIPLPGRHHALNWMSVVALVKQLGLDLAQLQEPVVLPEALQGRNQVIQLAGDIGLWDETYNAAPEAMIAALQALCQVPQGVGRRGAVLGAMRELGDHAPSLYAQVGSAVAHLPLDFVLLLDPDGEMDPLAQQVQGSQVFQTKAEVIEALVTQVQPGDQILFKAARAVGLEQVMQGFIERHRSQKAVMGSLSFHDRLE
ncbi:MAG: UDP-N-acetylmuramoyl-tripeptide--D-alanyl-D-alanine ligase [Cyanophyceae cyanobacterium]